MNIILASRTLVTVNLLNSSVVYNEIISIARTSLNKSCLSSFCTVTNFALGFATKTGTAATFSITLVSNFVKRKAFPKRFCHNDNNNTGNMFRGIDTALTIFMMRHKRHTSKPGPDSDSDPDSDSKKIRTREKPGPGLEKNPDSCLTKPGLDF